MEKVNIKNSRGLNLVGDFYTADSKKIIIMSHGFAYDRHEKQNKFEKIAAGFNNAKYNVLKFDFSGTGESDDSLLTIDNYTDDLKSVVKFVKDKGLDDVVLFGASLGGLISFKAYSDSIKAIVCLASPTDKAAKDWPSRHFSEKQLEELEKKGSTTVKGKGLRNTLVIGKEFLSDRENFNQKELLKDIKCPVLIFHANNDPFVSFETSKKAVEILGKTAELCFVKDAGHSFLNHLDLVVDKTINWLENKL